jgi:CubicO group peptidase (beta-lactamase class C family)
VTTARRRRLGTAIIAFVAAIPALEAQLPVSGRPVPGMTAFDTIMTDFMNSNGVTAGVLAISRAGRIEYLRGFGWLREPAAGQPGVPLPENAMMRTASVVKPVTAAAVRLVAAQGGFGTNGLNSLAFDNLIVGSTGLLSVTPSPSLGDSRSANITLNHLLLHQGGFDRNMDPPGDVMFKSRTVAAALNVNSPPSNRDIMRYMLGQSLQWAPGTVSNLNNPPGTDAYSNYGYMVLGEVLQAYAPGGYFGFVQGWILSPGRWIPSTEFALARALPVDRHPREPRYIASNNGQSVFDNDPPIDTVPLPDGGFHVEAMMAHGGTIASAPAMVRFANAFHLWYQNGDIGQPITITSPMQNYAHSGRLDGCNTWLQQRTNDVVFYLALNRTDYGDPDYAAVLAGRVNNQLSMGGFTWPDTESDGFWVTLGAENPTAGFGGYNSNYEGFQSALNQVTDGSYLRLRPGSQGWTGTITKRVRIDAPEGAALLGL